MAQHTITLKPGDSFVVTGVLYHGARFAPIHTNNYHYAMAINLWRGSVWLIRDNHRILLSRTYN